MENKEIYIDGVDVSGCFYYAEGKCLGCYALNEKDCISCYGICKEINDCHYKQLKRAEQRIVELNKTIQAKEQECEFSNLRIIQLQETLSQYETDLSTKDCIVETCKAQYKELKAENERLKNAVMLKCPQCGEVYLDPIGAKLYETLAEIKEIAQYDVYTSSTNLCLKLNWIKKKISECEVNNETKNCM